MQAAGLKMRRNRGTSHQTTASTLELPQFSASFIDQVHLGQDTSMIPLPAWQPIDCPDTLEIITAAGFTAAIGHELGRPQGKGAPPPLIAWWVHTQAPLPQPALWIDILAEGTAATIEEARTQAASRAAGPCRRNPRTSRHAASSR